MEVKLLLLFLFRLLLIQLQSFLFPPTPNGIGLNPIEFLKEFKRKGWFGMAFNGNGRKRSVI